MPNSKKHPRYDLADYVSTNISLAWPSCPSFDIDPGSSSTKPLPLMSKSRKKNSHGNRTNRWIMAFAAVYRLKTYSKNSMTETSCGPTPFQDLLVPKCLFTDVFSPMFFKSARQVKLLWQSFSLIFLENLCVNWKSCDFKSLFGFWQNQDAVKSQLKNTSATDIAKDARAFLVQGRAALSNTTHDTVWTTQNCLAAICQDARLGSMVLSVFQMVIEGSWRWSKWTKCLKAYPHIRRCFLQHPHLIIPMSEPEEDDKERISSFNRSLGHRCF